ncbi:predicted protein [Plenodomus lingam JN3]|uniref:Predicted protein n=1 Tax=Leptosphaeria maculans (strain JN3 / isolate v23.1.3 / race Av1-4-5-6-7-8) TaxID=985895 RepID=E5A354_LEPMJ|nr:predicted protein [Plenodomus lingam JN3]CBX98067.1 predicted protein [Plenodomus lingam JN3]
MWWSHVTCAKPDNDPRPLSFRAVSTTLCATSSLTRTDDSLPSSTPESLLQQHLDPFLISKLFIEFIEAEAAPACSAL